MAAAVASVAGRHVQLLFDVRAVIWSWSCTGGHRALPLDSRVAGSGPGHANLGGAAAAGVTDAARQATHLPAPSTANRHHAAGLDAADPAAGGAPSAQSHAAVPIGAGAGEASVADGGVGRLDGHAGCCRDDVHRVHHHAPARGDPAAGFPGRRRPDLQRGEGHPPSQDHGAKDGCRRRSRVGRRGHARVLARLLRRGGQAGPHRRHHRRPVSDGGRPAADVAGGADQGLGQVQAGRAGRGLRRAVAGVGPVRRREPGGHWRLRGSDDRP